MDHRGLHFLEACLHQISRNIHLSEAQPQVGVHLTSFLVGVAHQIEHHDPSEGYDRSEPAVPAIFGFTAGSVILLGLVIFALQAYFEQVYQDAVKDKILMAPSSQLQAHHKKIL